jgi:DNA ligase-1
LLRDGGGSTDDDDDEGDNNEKKQTGGNKRTDAAGGDEVASKGETTKKQPQQAVMSDLLTLVYLTSNTVAPQHENVELGVGDSILIKAIGEASGTSNDMIKKKYDKEGDLGNVAMNAKGKQRTLVGFGTKKVGLGGGPKRLSCVDVLRVFKEIANVSGSQSQKWKVDKIKSLLVRAKGYESKYIIRGLQGKLRIGLAQSTVLASLAHAIVLTKPCDVTSLTEEEKRAIRKLDGTPNAYPESARRLCTTNPEPPLDIQLEAATAIVKKAYNEVPSYDSLLAALLCTPLQELHKHCTLTPGVPVGPMLAKPTKSIKEVLKRLDGVRFTLEYKYDGERAQVHLLSNGKMCAFSRSLLDSSEKFPEVPLYCRESCATSGVTDFVLDTEVVAYNTETGQFLPFQVLSTRKRTGESADSSKIRVIVQAFDLMYLNGTSLLDKTLSERRELMKKNFLPIDGKFQ